MPQNIIILGAGGQAKVIADIVVKSGDNVLGFLDDNSALKEVVGYPVLGRVADIMNYHDQAAFIIAIGNNHIRQEISRRYDVRWHTAVHPSAQIGLDVSVGCGTVVMANAVINPSVRIGKHCIINTAAIIEHDNVVGDFVHVSPGAVLCGTVNVGEYTHIGAGAVVKNNISIGSGVIIGAGAAVMNNIAREGIYVGVPARRIAE